MELDIVYVEGSGYFTRSPKKDTDGNQLYLLPQAPLEEETATSRRIESTDVSEEPVMITTVEKVPLLDADGQQVSYIPTVRGEVLEDTGDPVWVLEETEDGQQEVQKVDDLGRALFWGQVPDPAGEAARVLCSELREQEVQKTDGDGALLYWNTVEETQTTYTPQEPLEITQEDERYTEDLEEAYELLPYETPEPQVAPSLTDRLSAMERAQSELQAAASVARDKVDSTSADLQAFMDYTFSQ